MTGPPGLVPQAVAIDLEDLVADSEPAAGGAVLLVVGLGEGLFGVDLDRGPVLPDRLAAVHGRDALIVQFHRAGDRRVLPEGALGVGHLVGAGEEKGLAGIGHPQAPERLDHLDLEAASAHLGIALDGRPPEHEGDPSVRQVEADRHLGIVLVGTVTDPEPAPGLPGRVEHVEVHAFIVVLEGSRIVRELVLRLQAGLEAGGGSGHGTFLPAFLPALQHLGRDSQRPEKRTPDLSRAQGDGGCLQGRRRNSGPV